MGAGKGIHGMNPKLLLVKNHAGSLNAGLFNTSDEVVTQDVMLIETMSMGYVLCTTNISCANNIVYAESLRQGVMEVISWWWWRHIGLCRTSI